MTTASASAVIAQTTAAQYQAWVQEIYTNLVTNCGLVQTNDSGQAAPVFAGALPTGTGVANATGFYTFTFNDSLAAGGLSTTALAAGGSGGTTGTYTNCVVTGVTSGANTARASVTVAGGAGGNLTITTAGSGYVVGEKLTITGATGLTGASWTACSLSSGAPVIFRLDFGAGSATTASQMWITVGAGTNGAGTIAGTAGTSRMTQVACFNGGALASTITAYTSRYVWNSTYGYLGLVFKQGAISGGTAAFGSIILCRTNDNGGNSTNNAAVLIANSTTTIGVTGNAAGAMQCMTWSGGVGSTIYPTLNTSSSSYWSSLGGNGLGYVFGLTTTLENSTAFIAPIYTIDPAIRFNAFNGIGIATDFPVGNTSSYAMIGSTALTFISCGMCFGDASGFASINTSALTFCMLWQ